MEAAQDTARGLSTRMEGRLTPAEQSVFAGLEVFCNYTTRSSPRTSLFFVKVYDGDRLVGLAPGMKLTGRRTTDFVHTRWLRGLGRLGSPFVRRNLVLLDTAFRAYDYASPFFCRDGVDRGAIAEAVFDHLRRQQDVHVVWIAEPAEAAHFAGDPRFASFPTLPMVHVRTAGADSLEAYIASLGKKRRRNFRQERAAFAAAGATIRAVEAPLESAVAVQVHRCLRESARRSALYVPYADLLNDLDAFDTQPQTVLLAEIGPDVIGFFSLIQRGETIYQAHGGFDYERSLAACAYHNLIYGSVELAIQRGCKCFSMGPLNNETKRRCGTDLRPVTVSLWNRTRFDRWSTRSLLIPRLQTRTGPVLPARPSVADFRTPAVPTPDESA